MARYNITLPETVVNKLAEEAKRQDVALSTLIAKYIEQYYKGKSEADVEAELQQSRPERADTTQRERDEREKRAQKPVVEREGQLQQVRADDGKQLQQMSADNAAIIEQFEDEEQSETTAKKLENDLKAPEERKASTVEKLRQSEGSKNTAVTGLHHNIALLQQKLANLETRLHAEPLEVPPVSDTGVLSSRPPLTLGNLGPIVDQGSIVDLGHPSAEPSAELSAEPSPDVPPVSDTRVRLTRPMGDILDIRGTNLERFSIEPSPDVPLTKNTCLRLIEAMHHFFVGNDDLIELLFISLLAEGNVLWTGEPGIAKTTIAKRFARALGCEFNYQRFNPDVLPSDVLGSYAFDQETHEHCLRKGGIFANIVMLDEPNRASPRTRADLLTSMEEKSVTIEGTTLTLERPFMVIATQSSLADDTDPLPKAEREQFVVTVPSDYPTSDEERQVVRTERDFEEGIAPVTDRASLLRMIEAVRGIYVDKSVEHYIQDIVGGIRRHPDFKLPAGPKASLSFLAISRARAAVRGRDYVIPDDVKDIAHAVLAHRLVLSEEAEIEGVTTAGIIDGVLANAQVIYYN